MRRRVDKWIGRAMVDKESEQRRIKGGKNEWQCFGEGGIEGRKLINRFGEWMKSE